MNAATEAATGSDWVGCVCVNLDFHRPHSARLKDYLLGGKTNFPADRELLGHVLAVDPGAARAAEHSRAFLTSTTTYLAATQGMRQYLDLGCGLPVPHFGYAMPDLHQIASGAAKAHVAVIYVDNDPIVTAHARALMRGRALEKIGVVHGDLTRPQEILEVPELDHVIDLGAPVAMSLHDVLHLLEDDDAHQALDLLKNMLAPGSTLTISHPASDLQPEVTSRVTAVYRSAGIQYRPRTAREIAAFFDGWEFLDPGLVPSHWWGRGSADPRGPESEARAYGAVARKPERRTS